MRVGGAIGSQKGMHPTWGEGGGVGRGRDGRGVAEGYAPCLGVGYCRKVVFEGLSRGVRGDALACRGHPYMFYIQFSFSFTFLFRTEKLGSLVQNIKWFYF